MKRILLPLALLATTLAVSSVEAVQLPKNTKFVEYIESDSTRSAYIDTGYVPNANTEIEMEFAFTRTDLTLKTYVFGAYYNAGRFQFSYGPDNCLFGFGGQNNYDNAVTGFAYNTARHVVKYVTGEGFFLDGTKVVAKDGVDLITWDGTSTNLYLGAVHGTGSVNTDYIAPLRIYSCKIWDNGELVRDFIPVLKDGTSPRLYNAVSGAFYKSAKSGSFTAGPVVPMAYRDAAYIEANRTAYIDTEYVPNANTELEMEFAFSTVLTTKTYVFGAYGNDSKGRFQFSYGPASTGCFLGYGNEYTNSFVISPYDTGKHVVKYVPGSGKGFYFDGNRVAPPKTDLTTWTGTSTNLFLGQINPKGGNTTPGNLAPIRIYSCKIWENGTPKRDLVPKQRKFDEKNGLYDNVTGNFYAYYGSGADFTAFIPLPVILFY